MGRPVTLITSPPRIVSEKLTLPFVKGFTSALLVTPAALVVWTVTDAMRPGSASGSVISSVKIKLSV